MNRSESISYWWHRFIGNHTIVELLERNYEVVCVDNLCNSKKSVIERIKRITNKVFSFYECDLRDCDKLTRIFEKEKSGYLPLTAPKSLSIVYKNIFVSNHNENLLKYSPSI